MVSPDGKYLENTQLEPDVVVKNRYEMLVKGVDQQLEKAVELLIQQFTQVPKPGKLPTLEKAGTNK
jgi:C-terminal processing protease CtpA/Prc